MKNKLVQKTKRLLSSIVAAAMATTMLPTLPAVAETGEKYPYPSLQGQAKKAQLLLMQEISV